MTMAQELIKAQESQGKKLLGQTSGAYSFHKNSNLYHKLTELGVTEDQVDVHTAARAGRNKNDGYQLLIFSKGKDNE
jgi:hypothetical protein